MLTVFLAIFGMPGMAQTGKSNTGLKVGKVDVDFQYGNLTPSLWHLTGRVKMTTEDYDLAGEDVKVYFAPGKTGASGLKRATVDGSPAGGKQMVAHIRQPLQSQAYEIFADHAVYLPDLSRPGGGRMDFTGHVKVIADSGFLAEPSVSTTEQATILMGQGNDYPQIITGPAHITLTPAQ